MEILGIGMGEGLVIIVAMLVIVGPERMIRWMFTIGQYVGKLQAMWRQTAAALQKELDQAGAGVTLPKEIPTRSTLQRDMARALQGVVQAEPGREIKVAAAERKVTTSEESVA